LGPIAGNLYYLKARKLQHRRGSGRCARFGFLRANSGFRLGMLIVLRASSNAGRPRQIIGLIGEAGCAFENKRLRLEADQVSNGSKAPVMRGTYKRKFHAGFWSMSGTP
jgi:hypothetical protein